MSLEYGLRVNHHASDHGELIIDGIRPALAAVRAQQGSLPAALRPHWRDGPHILIGLDLQSASEPNAAWSLLQSGTESWLDSQPGLTPPLDPDAYARRSRELAQAESIEYVPQPLRPDHSIERGQFPVSAPFGQPELALIRDSFKAAALDDIFSLVATRLTSPPAALLDYARLIVCLEHLKWRDGLNLWPLSLRGQTQVIGKAFPQINKTFPVLAEKLEPAFLAMLDSEGLLQEDTALSRSSRRWISTLQHTYDKLLEFVDRKDRDFFAAMHFETDHAQSVYLGWMNLTPQRAADILSQPTHFAYRMLVNLLYELLPSIGFSTSRRFFVCYFITRVLDHHYPDIVGRANHAGSVL